MTGDKNNSETRRGRRGVILQVLREELFILCFVHAVKRHLDERAFEI